METENAQPTSDFLMDVADQTDATPDRTPFCSQEPTNEPPVVSLASSIRFAEKFVYATSYAVSFGICFPIFLVCHYIPKENPVVRGLIAGSSDASANVDAWLTRPAASASAREALEEMLVAETGAGALASS